MEDKNYFEQYKVNCDKSSINGCIVNVDRKYNLIITGVVFRPQHHIPCEYNGEHYLFTASELIKVE